MCVIHLNQENRKINHKSIYRQSGLTDALQNKID